jgi:hypothetical protein
MTPDLTAAASPGLAVASAADIVMPPPILDPRRCTRAPAPAQPGGAPARRTGPGLTFL